MKKFCKIGFALVAMVQLPFFAHANEVEFMDGDGSVVHYEMAPVEVTATRSKKFLQDVQYSVDVVTAEEIEKMPVATFEGLLKNIPGVAVGNSSSSSNQIMIRGEGFSETLILVDGVKVSSRFVGVTSDSFVNPENIERIEIIKGPATVLYGAEALGGVVNIITKKAGKKPIQGEIITSYLSSSDAILSTASISGQLEKFGYRLSVDYTGQGDKKSYHDLLQDSDTDEYGFSAYADYQFNDDLKASLSYEYMDADINDRPFAYGGKNEKDSQRVVGTVDYIVNDAFEIKASAYYNEYNNHYTQLNWVTEEKRLSNQGDLASFGGNIQGTWSISDHTLAIMGYDYLHESFDFDREYITPTKLHPANTMEYRNGYQETHAVFLSMEHYLPYDFTLSYGARFTSFETGLDKNQVVYTNGTVAANKPADSETENAVVFNVGLVYSGIKNTSLRALWGQGFRAPSFQQKFIDNFGNGSYNTYYSNPDLKSETSNNFELGMRYDNGKFLADLAAYYTISDDRIVNNIPYLDGFRQGNAYNSVTFGFEYALSYSFENGIRPYVSGAMMRRKEDIGNGTEYVKDEPVFTGTLGVEYSKDFTKDLNFNSDVYLTYESGMTYYHARERKYKDNPSHTTLNLALGLTYKKDYFVQLEVLNLLDNKYQYRSNYTHYEPGINANLTFGVKF